MTADQGVVLAVLAGTLRLFAKGPWRYDLVALLALLVTTLAGLVPRNQAFAGFSHPAVITVGAVLIGDDGLSSSNSLDANGGTALMIHATADDMKTDPSGNAGGRIACGVITT